MTANEFKDIMCQVSQYNDRNLAFRSTKHAVKTLWVMLGDNGKFWVTTPRNCAKLEAAGYEFA